MANLLKSVFGVDRKVIKKAEEGNFEDLLGAGAYGEYLEQSYYGKMKLPYTREQMYELYDELDELSEISGVLTGYAEDACQKDVERDVTLWAKSKNNAIEKELNHLFLDVLNSEEWILALARDLGKYGDEFFVPKFEKDNGIVGVANWVFPYNIKRLETQDGQLVGFLDQQTVDQTTNIDKDNFYNVVTKPWEMVHFRIKTQNKIPGTRKRWIYGTSLLYGVRRSGRRMLLYSDLLFLYRLRQSFDRRVYYVDVGEEDYIQAIKILKKWRRSLEKRQYVDWQSENFRVTQDPWTLGEQIYWPRRSGTNSSIDTIPGNPNVADMADIDREENALFAGMNAPKEYFGFGNEGGMFDREKGLTLKDMRWGRAVYLLQRSIKVGLHRIGSIHLAAKGIDPREEKNRFQIIMVAPSILEKLQNLQAVSDMAEMADRVWRIGQDMELNPDAWKGYVLAKFFQFNEAESNYYMTGEGTAPSYHGRASSYLLSHQVPYDPDYSGIPFSSNGNGYNNLVEFINNDPNATAFVNLMKKDKDFNRLVEDIKTVNKNEGSTVPDPSVPS